MKTPNCSTASYFYQLNPSNRWKKTWIDSNSEKSVEQTEENGADENIVEENTDNPAESEMESENIAPKIPNDSFSRKYRINRLSRALENFNLKSTQEERKTLVQYVFDGLHRGCELKKKEGKVLHEEGK